MKSMATASAQSLKYRTSAANTRGFTYDPTLSQQFLLYNRTVSFLLVLQQRLSLHLILISIKLWVVSHDGVQHGTG
jgi:hypothetical protein